jgi:hypothetical protein
MAELKNLHAEIELTNPFTSSGGKSDSMPRLDTCHTCGSVQSMHQDNKCLFVSTMFKPVDQGYTEFRTKFMQWAHGQKIEDALCNIVYELTRRDR